MTRNSGKKKNVGKKLDRHFTKEDTWIVNKYMIRSSISFIIRDIQAKNIKNKILLHTH